MQANLIVKTSNLNSIGKKNKERKRLFQRTKYGPLCDGCVLDSDSSPWPQELSPMNPEQDHIDKKHLI